MPTKTSIRTLQNSLLVFTMLGFIGACSPVEFSQQKGPECQSSTHTCIVQDGLQYFDYTESVPAPNYQTDILIVDDNSGSMTAEQQSMAQRFTSFLNSITRLDWRIGIVTTDMSGTGPLQNGSLLFFSDTSSYFITKAMPNAATAFQHTVQISTTGSGDERGIYAALSALQRRKERNLIRDSANLAVVILSDEDERSNGGTATGNQGGPLEIGKDYPSDLINYVNNTWSHTKKMTVHSIIIEPNDLACFNTQKEQQPYGNANYGNTYVELTNQTGGTIGTVCASDYGSQLSAIGDVIEQAALSSLLLECAPASGSLQIAPTSLHYELRGDKVIFDPALQPGTSVHLKYQCLR